MINIRLFRTLDHYSCAVTHINDHAGFPDGLAPTIEQLGYCTFPDLPDDEPERVVEMVRAALGVVEAHTKGKRYWADLI